MLQGARVVAIVGDLEPTGMAKHVWVDGEWHLCGLPEALGEAVKTDGADRPAALGNEYVGVLRVLASQLAERPHLVTADRVHAGNPVLDTVNVQAALGQLDLLPLQVADLRRPQAMAVGDQDHGRIPMPVAAMLSGALHQPLDLALGETASRKFDIVMAWAIDRLGRFLIDLLDTIQHLEACGVDLYLDVLQIEANSLFRASGNPGATARGAWVPAVAGTNGV